MDHVTSMTELESHSKPHAYESFSLLYPYFLNKNVPTHQIIYNWIYLTRGNHDF